MLTPRQLQVFCRTSCMARQRYRWSSTSTSSIIPEYTESTANVFTEQPRGPWGFKSTTRKSQAFTGSLAMRKRKEQLAKLAEFGKIVQALELTTKWKTLPDFTPDLDIYNALMQLCATSGLPNEARAFFADMLFMGVKPDVNTFNHFLKAERFSSVHVIHEVFDMMAEHGVEPDSGSYHQLIVRYAFDGQLEMCLRLLAEMSKRGIVPTIASVHFTVRQAAGFGLASLAVDIAKDFEEQGVRRLETETWVDCLSTCANEYYAEGVVFCWEIIKSRGSQLHEGLLLQILHTAARHGLSNLALEATDALAALGENFVFEPHHCEPVLETFYHSGDLQKINQALRIMRQKVSIPNALPHLPLKGEITTLDQAFEKLRVLSETGETIDPTLFNTLLKECMLREEPQRALGYLRMASSLDLNPTVETYHSMLRAATISQYNDLADSCVTLAMKQGIKLDLSMYKDKEMFVNRTNDHKDTHGSIS